MHRVCISTLVNCEWKTDVLKVNGPRTPKAVKKGRRMKDDWNHFPKTVKKAQILLCTSYRKLKKMHWKSKVR